MKQKYIEIPLISHVLTYLLVIVTFVLGEKVFENSYVIAGILLSTIGFSLSWLTKDKKNKIKQILTNAGYLSVTFFETYKLLKSSFLFEDILFLTLEGALTIQVIVSFDSRSSRNLKCIQVLSLITFAYLFLFVNTSSLLYISLSILYLFIWSVIIKTRMHGKNKMLPFSALPSYLIYFLILSLALFTASLIQKKIVFNASPQRKYILETKKFDMPNKLYDLQASLFKSLISSADKSPKDRKKIMQTATSLFQESSDVGEFEAANITINHFLQERGPANIPGTKRVPGDDGLVDPLKRPGSGIEPWGNDAGVKQKEKKPTHDEENNQSLSTLEEYVSLKTDFESKTLQDNILGKITSKNKTLKTKIKTLLHLNNIQRAKTQDNINSEINSLNKSIKELSLDDQVKRDLDKMVANLKGWKLYSIYSNLSDSLKEKLQDADKNEKLPGLPRTHDTTHGQKQNHQSNKKLKKDVTDLIQEIEKATTVRYHTELKKLAGLNITEDKELKENFDNLLDKMMSSSSPQETAFLMKKLEDTLAETQLKSASPSTIKKMKDNLNKLKEIKDKSFLSENISSLIYDLSALKSMNKEGEIKNLEKIIASIEQSSLEGEFPNKDLIKELEDMLDKDKLKSASSSEKKVLENYQTIPLSWQIVVFPRKLVLDKERTANIKVIGFYDNSLIKDLTGEVSWTLEDSSIARINSQGIISAISTGQTKATANYGGSNSYDVEIIVLEPLGPEALDLIKYLK